MHARCHTLGIAIVLHRRLQKVLVDCRKDCTLCVEAGVEKHSLGLDFERAVIITRQYEQDGFSLSPR